jgi:acyl dehydratase
VHSGDTLYSQLVIKSLEEVDGKGLVTTAVTVHNQNGDVVLTGEHEYLLRLTPGTAAGIAGE